MPVHEVTITESQGSGIAVVSKAAPIFAAISKAIPVVAASYKAAPMLPPLRKQCMSLLSFLMLYWWLM